MAGPTPASMLRHPPPCPVPAAAASTSLHCTGCYTINSYQRLPRLRWSHKLLLLTETNVSVPPVSVITLICLVVAISDGNTLTARCGSPSAYEQVKVRIAAIDAPESRQAFGRKCRQNLAQLCFRQQAALQPLEQDSYGRTVANLRCSGTDVASAQVRAGLAWVYPAYAQRHPHLAALERQARSSSTGLWSQKRPQPPWTYRRRHAR